MDLKIDSKKAGNHRTLIGGSGFIYEAGNHRILNLQMLLIQFVHYMHQTLECVFAHLGVAAEK